MPCAEVLESPTPGNTSSSSSARLESRTASSPRAQDNPEAAPAGPPSAGGRTVRTPGGGGGGGTSAEPTEEPPQRRAPGQLLAGGDTEADRGRRAPLSFPVGGLIRAGTAGEGVRRGELTRGSSATSLATLSQEQPARLRSLSQPEPPVRLSVSGFGFGSGSGCGCRGGCAACLRLKGCFGRVAALMQLPWNAMQAVQLRLSASSLGAETPQCRVLVQFSWSTLPTVR